MAKHQSFAPCVFLPYRLCKQTPTGAVVYDVSSYADHPFCLLSPMWPHGGIVVPGMPGKTSDSVEGIWQSYRISPEIAPLETDLIGLFGQQFEVAVIGVHAVPLLPCDLAQDLEFP